MLFNEIGWAAIAGFFTMLFLFGSLGKIMGKMVRQLHQKSWGFTT